MPDTVGINVVFYVFDKRKNSDKAPTAQTYSKSTYCTLKKPSSVSFPVLELRWTYSELDPFRFTYCYIADFGRRYFVKEWTSVYNDFWQVELEVDVLASFLGTYRANNFFVLRASDLGDSTIIDDMYPATNETEHSLQFAYATNLTDYKWSVTPSNNTPWKSLYGNGMYVVGILNGDYGSGGTVNYYMFTSSQFNVFKSILLGDGAYAAGDFSGIEISQGLWKSLFNPVQYITTCKWFPISPSDTSLEYTSESSVQFGWWEFINCPCQKLTKLSWECLDFCFKGPEHPQAFDDYEHVYKPYRYLNYSPFTECMLYIPPFGSFKIPLDELGYREYIGTTVSLQRYLRGKIKVDFVSGVGTLLVDVYEKTSTADILLKTAVYSSTMIGIDIAIGQISTDALGIAGGFAQTVGGLATSFISGNPAGALTAIGGVLNAFQASIPTAETRGTNGSISQYQIMPFEIQYTYHYTTEKTPIIFGIPYYKSHSLQYVVGYVKVANARASLITEVGSATPGSFFVPTDSEKDMMAGIMEEGFYIERTT